MQQKIRIIGNSRRYGTRSRRTHRPTSGRLMMSSIRLPIHIEAIMPQNSSGCLVMTCGPGTMPWMVMAPTISAITAFGGMPSVSSGMNEVCARGVVGRFRRRDAFDGAAAEALADPWRCFFSNV